MEHIEIVDIGNNDMSIEFGRLVNVFSLLSELRVPFNVGEDYGEFQKLEVSGHSMLISHEWDETCIIGPREICLYLYGKIRAL